MKTNNTKQQHPFDKGVSIVNNDGIEVELTPTFTHTIRSGGGLGWIDVKLFGSVEGSGTSKYLKLL